MVINKKGKQPNLLEVGLHCQVWGVVYDGMGIVSVKNKQKIPDYLSVENSNSVYLNIIVMFFLSL